MGRRHPARRPRCASSRLWRSPGSLWCSRRGWLCSWRPRRWAAERLEHRPVPRLLVPGQPGFADQRPKLLLDRPHDDRPHHSTIPGGGLGDLRIHLSRQRRRIVHILGDVLRGPKADVGHVLLHQFPLSLQVQHLLGAGHRSETGQPASGPSGCRLEKLILCRLHLGVGRKHLLVEVLRLSPLAVGVRLRGCGQVTRDRHGGRSRLPLTRVHDAVPRRSASDVLVLLGGQHLVPRDGWTARRRTHGLRTACWHTAAHGRRTAC